MGIVQFFRMDGKKKIHISYYIEYISIVFVVGAVDDVEGFARSPLSLNMQGVSILLTAYM
jgi:hypothetical protein